MEMKKEEPELKANEGKEVFESENLEEHLRRIVTKDTVYNMTAKTARRQLEEKMSLPSGSMDDYKDVIKKILTKIASEIDESEESNDDDNSDHESGSSDESEPEPKPKKAAAKRGHKKAQEGLMTKKDFKDNSKTLQCHIGDHEFSMDPREFSTGSSGWYYGSKIKLPVGDQSVMCQVSLNCAVLGSKEWKESTPKNKRKEPPA